jgi:hypothetical protein
VIAHFGKTKLELTVFVVGSGPGLGSNVRRAADVDVAPTVLHQLGLRVPRRWNLEGRSLSRERSPSSAFARLRGGRLTARLRLGARPRARDVAFHLPARVKGGVAVYANGRPAAWTAEGRTVRLRLRRGRLRSLSLAADVGGRTGGSVVVTMRGGKLAIPLR